VKLKTALKVVKEMPDFYGNRRFVTAFTRAVGPCAERDEPDSCLRGHQFSLRGCILFCTE
jgi:hypothetical protein